MCRSSHPAASQKDKPTDSDNDHPEHITCMVALPFKDDENTFSYNKILLPALQDVLERDPYYWQVSRADERYFEAIIQLNVAVWMERVHAYIVDISDKNPNVMMELGYMLWAKKDRPLIVLSREGTDRQLADLGGYICIPYPATKAGGDSGIDEVVNRLKEELRKHEGIKALNQSKQAHYLSAIFLKKDYGASIEIARSLSQIFTSMEAIEAATDEAFRQRTRAIPEEQADGARKFILRRLKEIRDSQ